MGLGPEPERDSEFWPEPRYPSPSGTGRVRASETSFPSSLNFFLTTPSHCLAKITIASGGNVIVIRAGMSRQPAGSASTLSCAE